MWKILLADQNQSHHFKAKRGFESQIRCLHEAELWEAFFAIFKKIWQVFECFAVETLSMTYLLPHNLKFSAIFNY